MADRKDYERILAASESDARLFMRTEILTRAFAVATFIVVPYAIWAFVTGRHAVPVSQLVLTAAIAPIGLVVSAWLHRRVARKHRLPGALPGNPSHKRSPG